MSINYLTHISDNVSLREGSEGVRNFFRVIYQNYQISTKECARKLKMPIPIVAAMKQEAIKIDLVKTGSTLRLTDKGISFCQNILKLAKHQENICTNCLGLKYIIPAEYEDIEAELEEIFDNRPTVNVKIDQAHATAKTSLRRAILALEKGALFDKKIAFLGDDDYVSIAIMLLYRHIFKDNELEMVVFDIDERILSHIQKIAKEYNFPLKVVLYDVRNELRDEYQQYFDVVFTDPPYTSEGASLFALRANMLLRAKQGLYLFFSYGHKSPKEMLLVQNDLIDLGFCYDEIIPNFNRYLGASIIANTSQMIVLVKADCGKKIDVEAEKQIYTGQK